MKSGLAEHGADARPLWETETVFNCATGRQMRHEGMRRLSQRLELTAAEAGWWESSSPCPASSLPKLFDTTQ